MSNLLASIVASAGALKAFEQSLAVTQENVDNASTPGYARQTMTLQALPFNPLEGQAGGVQAGQVQSTRDPYADQEVRRQLQALGFVNQKVSSLADLQSLFDISGKTGIAAGLNSFFQSLSAWSASPGDAAVGQTVLQSAASLAQSFQSTAADLSRQAGTIDQQLGSTVDQINHLTAQLQQYNQQRMQTMGPDAGLDAKINSTLEELSQFANFDAVRQADGTVTVLLGGQTPLVIGNQHYAIHVANQQAATSNPAPGVLPATAVISADGRDVTGLISGGTLGALLDTRNHFLPSLLGDANQPGALNRLAQAVADRVNKLLTSGQTDGGSAGKPLFTYDSSSAANVARTLAVDPSLQPGDLAAADPGPPPVSNGIALKLAGLATPSDSADEIDGFSYAEFFGNIAGAVGQELSSAQNNQDAQKQVVAQAQSQRDQISGVSLDDEAVQMMEFQRAYQATAKLLNVLNELTQTTVDMLH